MPRASSSAPAPNSTTRNRCGAPRPPARPPEPAPALLHLGGDEAREDSADLRAGAEIDSRPALLPRAGVVPQSRLVENLLHEAPERARPAGAGLPPPAA